MSQHTSRQKRGERTLSAVSLFTGAGGLDLGFEAAGFETRVAVEFDHDAAETLRRNREWPLIEADIHSESAASKKLLEKGKLRQGEADVLIGGPPCQPFSKSGYWARGDSLRLDDPRASTLSAYLRVLEDLLPASFLLENVPGIAFHEKSEGLQYLEKEIRRINKRTGSQYTFRAEVLKATDFGVPQDRHRVFVIGHRDGKAFRFPDPSHGAVSEGALFGHKESLLTAWDAIGDLEDDDNPELKVTGKWAQLLPSIPEGCNYLYHTSRGDGVELFGWRRRFWNFLLKLSKSQPSWTISAQPGPAIGPFHWKNRRLSPRELCRLQTFPEPYYVKGNLRSVQRQIGNAVPSALAERLAIEIRTQFFDQPRRAPSLVPQRRGGMPAPERTAQVPRKYMALVRPYSAHPGTGLGYAATRR